MSANWLEELLEKPFGDLSLDAHFRRLEGRFAPEDDLIEEANRVVSEATAAEKSSILAVTQVATDDEGWSTILPPTRVAAVNTTQQIVAGSKKSNRQHQPAPWRGSESRELRALRRNLGRLGASKSAMDTINDMDVG